MPGISHHFRVRERLEYECTKLAKFIAPAVLTKGSHTTKSSCSTLEVRKTIWRNEKLEMIHSFSRSPVYQIAAVRSAKIIASVKKWHACNKKFMPHLLRLEQTIQLKEII